MEPTYTKKQEKKIVGDALCALGLSLRMSTDPKVMKLILEEFKLDDFETSHLVMRKFLNDVVSKPQRLQPLVCTIKNAIIAKHPALIECIDSALKHRWFQSSSRVVRAVHVTYLLEALTATMCNSHDFFVEIQNHYKAKEYARGIYSIHLVRTFLHALGVTHTLFGTIKALSVDPLMIYFRMQRGLTKSYLRKNEAQKLLKDGEINIIEYRLLSPLRKHGLERLNEIVRINIYEAGITEYKKGFTANAVAAHELTEDIRRNPPRAIFQKKCIVPEHTADSFYNAIEEKGNAFPVVTYSQKWTSLYTAWNLTFLISNLDELDILIPKLFIPSLIDSKPENFIGVRAISLWLSVNHFFFRRYDKRTISGPVFKEEMARAWGEITKKYAIDMAQRETHEKSCELMKGYNLFFSHPFANFLHLIKNL